MPSSPPGNAARHRTCVECGGGTIDPSAVPVCGQCRRALNLPIAPITRALANYPEVADDAD